MNMVSIDIDGIVASICARGLQRPAMLFLEMHKPLLGVAHAATQIGSPILTFAIGRDRTSQLLQLLSSPEAVESLIDKLELADGN